MVVVEAPVRAASSTEGLLQHVAGRGSGTHDKADVKARQLVGGVEVEVLGVVDLLTLGVHEAVGTLRVTNALQNKAGVLKATRNAEVLHKVKVEGGAQIVPLHLVLADNGGVAVEVPDSEGHVPLSIGHAGGTLSIRHLKDQVGDGPAAGERQGVGTVGLGLHNTLTEGDGHRPAGNQVVQNRGATTLGREHSSEGNSIKRPEACVLSNSCSEKQKGQRDDGLHLQQRAQPLRRAR
mmetsp:Transcript_12775/g.32585  ORF Transcript_12775/g.32585 Transcript_12775/m.32585 type:complete len:236 (+) Transcript_12775:358-1065(+)